MSDEVLKDETHHKKTFLHFVIYFLPNIYNLWLEIPRIHVCVCDFKPQISFLLYITILVSIEVNVGQSCL